MKKINTRLTQNVVDQISKSGMSVYAFIQKAVEEKLENDKFKIEKEDLGEIVRNELVRFQDDLIKIYKVHLDEKKAIETMIQNALEIYNQKGDEARTNIIKILQDINQKIGAKNVNG